MNKFIFYSHALLILAGHQFNLYSAALSTLVESVVPVDINEELVKAAKNGNLDKVKRLIAKGAKITSADALTGVLIKLRPFNLFRPRIIQENNLKNITEIIRLLISVGAEVNSEHLKLSITYKLKELVKLFLINGVKFDEVFLNADDKEISQMIENEPKRRADLITTWKNNTAVKINELPGSPLPKELSDMIAQYCIGSYEEAFDYEKNTVPSDESESIINGLLKLGNTTINSLKRKREGDSEDDQLKSKLCKFAIESLIKKLNDKKGRLVEEIAKLKEEENDLMSSIATSSNFMFIKDCEYHISPIRAMIKEKTNELELVDQEIEELSKK